MTRTVTLAQYAKENPSAKVRLTFKNESGTGTLVLPASEALEPNKSLRYFPPQGTSAAAMGWPVPYWHKAEAIHWEPAPTGENAKE